MKGFVPKDGLGYQTPNALPPMQKQQMAAKTGGRRNPNPLKRTNSYSEEKNLIEDSYSFYMYTIKDKKHSAPQGLMSSRLLSQRSKGQKGQA